MEQKKLKKDIDSMMKELINEKYNSIECPPMEEICQELEYKLNYKKKKSKKDYTSNKPTF